MFSNFAEYVAGLEEKERLALEEVRRMILEAAPEAEDCVSYGMPAFRVRGKVIAGVAAWKNHLSYYPFSGSVLSHFKEDLKGFKGTKSAVHFTPEKMIPAELIRKMVTMRLGG